MLTCSQNYATIKLYLFFIQLCLEPSANTNIPCLYFAHLPLAACHLTGPCKLCGSLLNVYVPRCQPFYSQKVKKKKKNCCRQTGAPWAIFICRILFMQQLQPGTRRAKKNCLAVIFFFCNCFTNIFGNFTVGKRGKNRWRVWSLVTHLI